MNLPNSLYDEWRDIFFNNLDQQLVDWIGVAYCDEAFSEWVWTFTIEDMKPLPSQIVKFAWQMNAELAALELEGLCKANGE